MKLKDYQDKALKTLENYFDACVSLNNANTAFYTTTLKDQGRGREYHEIKELPGLPYVCFRIPTGGGKTFMACHSVGIAQRRLLQVDNCVILWLVPSNAIREQTLKALKDKKHPYRQALEEKAGSIEILDIREALYVQRALFDSHTIVIISTMQAFRVEDTEGRKVYEQSGHLQSHFLGLPPEIIEELERFENGEPITSLANVLRIRRPVIIVDEAHNARTELSFDTLARFNPSVILEYTATPDIERNPSNVLYSCSAWELKSEEMIKIPIRIETRADWKQILADANYMLDELDKKATDERTKTGEYIRPIMLLQAQAKSSSIQTIDYGTVKESLIVDCNIPKEQIAIVTGEHDELIGVNLFDSNCPIRFVITVQALREGWDCSFAYILCSVANIRSSRSVEQILGRILRLPNTKRKTNEALNYGYAFVTSTNFSDVAQSLQYALEQNGFKRHEAKEMVSPFPQEEFFPSEGDLFSQPTGVISTPREPLSVPVLAIKTGDLFEEFEETHLLEFPCDYNKWDYELNERDYSFSTSNGVIGEIDTDIKGVLQLRFIENMIKQVAFFEASSGWTEGGLVYWLDHTIRHPDIPPTDSGIYIWKVIHYLLDHRHLSLDELVKDKFRLCRAIEVKINTNRKMAKEFAFQSLLFQDETKVNVTPDLCFKYSPFEYKFSSPYQGSYKWSKHYYEQVCDLKENGEEFRCAQFLDQLPEVKFWVRNIPGKQSKSFWLQTASDKFYPDFICQLVDGRYLAVEYKGGNYLDGVDAREKKALGELWERRSGGKCLFDMPSNNRFESILAKLK